MFDSVTALKITHTHTHTKKNCPHYQNLDLLNMRKKKVPQIALIENYLLEDEGSARAGDDVDEVEIAVADFFDAKTLQLFAQLGAKGGCGLDVLHQGFYVQRPEPILRRRRHSFDDEECGLPQSKMP